MFALDEPVLVRGEVLADGNRFDLINLSQGFRGDNGHALVGKLGEIDTGHKSSCKLGFEQQKRRHDAPQLAGCRVLTDTGRHTAKNCLSSRLRLLLIFKALPWGQSRRKTRLASWEFHPNGKRLLCQALTSASPAASWRAWPAPCPAKRGRIAGCGRSSFRSCRGAAQAWSCYRPLPPPTSPRWQ